MAHRIKVTCKLNKAKIKGAVSSGGQKGLWMAADHLAAVSKEQVPLDLGPLKNSCTVDVSAEGATVSYDTPYAIIQHENMSFNHQRGRKAKYLEDPCNDGAVQRKCLDLLRQGMAGEMGG